MNTNIYFEEKLINKAGVDRLVFSHVELIEINRSILHSAVTESSNLIFDDLKVYNRTYYVTNNGDRFHHMRISDPEIGTLTFGANPQKYGIWEFSPCNFRDGNNLVNFSRRELIDYLEYTLMSSGFITAQYICKEFDEESVLKKQILFCNTILEVNS